MKEAFKYFCETCGSEYDIEREFMLCPKCRDESLEGKPLRGILKVKLPAELRNSKRPLDDFDVYDYLPVEREFFPPLPVGDTPLIRAPKIQRDFGFANLLLKFDGTNPTGSFKDRASFLVSAFARKKGIQRIAVASTGNAASSMAGVGASAEQDIIIFMPAAAPRAKLVQCLQYGAAVIPIRGSYDTAFDLSLKFTERTGCLSRNTAYNPLTIEGKKTVSFEVIAQAPKRHVDYMILPVGDGVILSGVIKGFEDLVQVGLLKSIPKIIGVQAEGSSFIYTAFYHNNFDLKYKASTVADSISVNAARNGYTAVEDLRRVRGDVVLVSDDDILEAQHYLSRTSGVFCEPSSAASFAGFAKIQDTLPRESTIVLLLTGHGLKDIESAMKSVTFPQSVEPDIDKILVSMGYRA